MSRRKKRPSPTLPGRGRWRVLLRYEAQDGKERETSSIVTGFSEASKIVRHYLARGFRARLEELGP